MRKEGKTHGNKTTPQITMHKIKNEKEQKTVVKQPCPSLQEDLTTVQVCALEDFVEDVDVCTDLMKYMHH